MRRTKLFSLVFRMARNLASIINLRRLTLTAMSRGYRERKNELKWAESSCWTKSKTILAPHCTAAGWDMSQLSWGLLDVDRQINLPRFYNVAAFPAHSNGHGPGENSKKRRPTHFPNWAMLQFFCSTTSSALGLARSKVWYVCSDHLATKNGS